jgi:hypothetical protein
MPWRTSATPTFVTTTTTNTTAIVTLHPLQVVASSGASRQLVTFALHPHACEAGTWLSSSSDECEPCPVGRFGATAGLTTMDCTGPCPVGHACPLYASSPIPCAPGTYSDTTACVLCPLATPYSTALSIAPANCTNCSVGCEGGLHGARVCPRTGDPSLWRVWYDKSGAEGANSCLYMNDTDGTWDVGSQTCKAMDPAAHLLTINSFRPDDAYSLARMAAASLDGTRFAFVGATRDNSMAPWGFRWVDGTPNTYL